LYLFIRVIKQTSNYRGASLLSTTYKILYNILLSRLIVYAEEIIGDHHCGFQHNKSTTHYTFCNCQVLQKKLVNNEALHQLFIDFKTAYDSVTSEVLYNVLIEFGFPMKLLRLIKMFLNETYSRVPVGKHLSDTLPTKNGLGQGDALSPLLSNFVLECAINTESQPFIISSDLVTQTFLTYF
jgi:hypothetical protein